MAWDVPSSNAQTSAWNTNDAAWGAEPTSAWHQNDSAWDDSSKPSHSQLSEPVNTVNNNEDSKPTQQSQSSAPPGFGAPPKPNSRAAQRARQDAAVVMPGAADNKSFGNAIGVQFGSLSLLDNATGYEEQPKQSNTTQPQQESVSVPQPEPASAPAPAPAASQPTQPATQPATQQTDISAYTSQQPQQDVYGQYFQQPQQPQQQQQPTETTQQQPITSQAIPPQFQQYNQTATPTPDAYSNVFSNLGAQPNQLSGGAFGQQSQNDYATLYNDQAQRVSEVFYRITIN